MESILNSTQHCPLPIRNIAQYLQDAIVNKFPESKYSVIGGFYFLRFLCPAIISPDGFNIVPHDFEISPEVRRVLILVSKVIQTIANEREFNEEFMLPFNQLVVEYREVTSYFCNTLSKVPPPNSMQNDYVPQYEVLWDVYVEDLDYIKNLVIPKIDQIKEALSLSIKETGKKREVIKNLLQDLEMDLSQLPVVVDSDKTPMKDVFIKAKPIKTIRNEREGSIKIGIVPNLNQSHIEEFTNNNDDTINRSKSLEQGLTLTQSTTEDKKK